MGNLVSKIDNLLNWEDFEDNNHSDSTIAKNVSEMAKQDKNFCHSSFAKNVQELKELSERVAVLSLDHLPKDSEQYLQCVDLQDRIRICDKKIQTSLKEANNLLMSNTKASDAAADAATDTYFEVSKGSYSRLFSLDRHLKAGKIQACLRRRKLRKTILLYLKQINAEKKETRFASLVQAIKTKKAAAAATAATAAGSVNFDEFAGYCSSDQALCQFMEEFEAQQKQFTSVDITKMGTIFPSESMLVEKRFTRKPNSEDPPGHPAPNGYVVLCPTKMMVAGSAVEIANPPTNIRFFVKLEQVLDQDIPSEYEAFKNLMRQSPPFNGDFLLGTWQSLGNTEGTYFTKDNIVYYMLVSLQSSVAKTQVLTKCSTKSTGVNNQFGDDPPMTEEDKDTMNDPDGFALVVHENDKQLLPAEFQKGAYTKPLDVIVVPKLNAWQKRQLLDVSKPANIHSAEYILTEGSRHYLVHLYSATNGNACQELFEKWADTFERNHPDYRFVNFMGELVDGNGMIHGPYSHKELLNYFESHVISISRENKDCLVNLNMCIFTHVSYKYTMYDDQVQRKPAWHGMGSIFLRRKSATVDTRYVRQEKIKFEDTKISEQFLTTATTASEGWVEDYNTKIPALVENLWMSLSGGHRKEWTKLFSELSLINNKLQYDMSEMEKTMGKIKNRQNLVDLIPNYFRLWVPLRPGSGRDAIDDNIHSDIIQQEKELFFQQNGDDTCVACAAGNALIALGLPKEWAKAVFSEMVAAHNTINDDKDVLNCAIQKHCPGYQLEVTTAPPFLATGPPRILFYEDKAGAKDHAFSSFGGLFFDGRFKYPLKACNESLQIIYPNGTKNKGPYRHYNIVKKKKNKKKKKRTDTNNKEKKKKKTNSSIKEKQNRKRELSVQISSETTHCNKRPKN
jgi:hypothetical protein